MDWLTFIAANIKSLAWPTVAVTILFVLKRQIAELLRAFGNRILSAKGAGFEFTFAERVDAVEEILPPADTKEITSKSDAQRAEKISELSGWPPPYIVSQAWLRLDQAFQENVKLPPSRRTTRPPHTLDYLHWADSQGLLTDDERPVVLRLREMRNIAAHSADPNITMTDALRYWDVAETLIRKIKERRATAEQG